MAASSACALSTVCAAHPMNDDADGHVSLYGLSHACLRAWVCVPAGNLISASNDSFIKVWNSTGVQRPFTAKS